MHEPTAIIRALPSVHRVVSGDPATRRASGDSSRCICLCMAGAYLKPGCLVQLPLDAENAETRKGAITVLHSLLGQAQRAVQGGSTQATDPHFLRTALSRLTAGELVQLYDWPAFASQASNVSW